jgi:hypothetical protein
LDEGNYPRAPRRRSGEIEFSWGLFTEFADQRSDQPPRRGHFHNARTVPSVEHGNSHTARGKAEVYSEGLKVLGLDPVAEFSPPTESRHDECNQRFPLELLARKAENF